MPKDIASDGLLLSVLDKEQRGDLLGLGRQVHYPKGRTIFVGGSTGDTMLVITSGRVEVSVVSQGGRRSALAQMGKGDVLGELATLDGGTRSADAVAAVDVTGTLLTRTQVFDYLERNPSLAVALLQELCRKLRATSELLASQQGTTVAPRLALVILRLFDKWGEDRPEGGQRLSQVLSQTEIGNLAGIARENVSRQIGQWQRNGIVAKDGRHLVLLDVARLKAAVAT